MNVPAKVVATVMVVTVAALVFQSSPAPVSAAAGDAEATATSLILSGVLQGLGKGVGNEVSEQATQWGLSMLGFNPGGSTADIGPELDAIEKTLNQILAAQQQVNADLNNLACDTWTTAILGQIATINANWNTYSAIASATAKGKTSNLTPGFLTDVLGTDETALGMQTALETINGAVFPSAGTGVVDTCLKAAALSDPPAPYELDSIWYDTYVVPFQNSLMLEYTRAMTMVVNAYHQKALLAAQANGMPAGDFSNLAPLICDGFYDGNDPLSTSKPSSYCDSADAFVSTHLSDLRKIVARGGTPYTDDLVAYYTGTGYLLPRSLGQYGSSTVGTYDARLANSSGYDGYTGTWEAAPVKVFKEILTGWKDLGGKDTTTAAYWLCHGTGDTSVAGDACSGLIGLDKAIIIFPETGKISKFNDKKYFCFMDGSIPRNKVEGQPFCSDDGFSVSSLFHSDGKCDSVSAYKQHTWTQSLASGDPTFYEMSVDNLGRWCLEPGYTNLTTKKPRWPAFNINQIVCAGGYPATNPAGLPTKCGSDLTLWLNQIVPLAPVGTTTQPAPQALAPDSHAPVIEASLDFVADQPGSLGHFEVSYSCTDDVDNVVFLEARLNGVTVENGDTAELIPSSFEAFSYSTEGQPHIVWDKSFELTVTCSDKSGNTSEVTVPAVLQQANGTAS